MLRRTARSTGQPLLEKLENRQLMAVSPVIAGTKIKGINLSANNISTNQTLITIPFTGNITLTDQSKLRLFGYAINPLSSNLGQVKKTVNVVSATVIETDVNNDGVKERNYLQITTDRLMRKGGSIVINEGALTDDNGDLVATQTRKTVKGQNKERFTLSNRAFQPTNFNRFTNTLFASSPVPASASNTVDLTTANTNLTNFLQKKVTAGTITQQKANDAVVRFNSAAAKGTIPDHNLRAALFSLTGTFAEGAIASWLDGANVTGKPYTIIDFVDPGDNSVEVAQTTARASDGRLRTVFRPEFKGEPFQVLSAWVAHEALHQDNVFGLQEEVAANTFATMVNAQQAAADPTYLASGTKLVNMENEKLLAMLNSGRTIFPYVGLLNGPNINATGGVFQGQKASADAGGVYTSYNDYIRRRYILRGSPSGDTTGNALLSAYYTAVSEKTAPANQKFSDAIITDLDGFQNAIGIKLAIQLAKALKLKLS